MDYREIKKNIVKFLEMVYFAETASEAYAQTKKKFKGDNGIVLIYLRHKKLIKEYFIEGKGHRNLTEKGVEFYENFKKERIQNEFNRVIAFTGAIVALVYVYNFLDKSSILHESIKFYIMISISIIISFSAIYLIIFAIKSMVEALRLKW